MYRSSTLCCFAHAEATRRAGGERSSMETMTFSLGHLFVRANIAGSCCSATNTMVISAWLILRGSQRPSKRTEHILVHVLCNLGCQRERDQHQSGLLTNDVRTQCIIQTDTNLFVSMQCLIDDLPFYQYVLGIIMDGLRRAGSQYNRL